jgi:hypothetical protein
MAATVAAKKCQAPQGPTPEEVRQALERILDSKHFAHAPMKRRFLQLVCEAYIDGRTADLNEYLIGFEVFGRDQTYNPALDPIVRVGAHELRKKLEDYYRSEGEGDEIILEIPVGSYSPIFTRRQLTTGTVTESKGTSVSTPPSSLRAQRIWIATLGLATVSLIIIAGLLASSNRQLRRPSEQAISRKEVPAVYAPVWGPFLEQGNPTLVVLGNPPVYRFENPADPDSLLKNSIELAPLQVQALANTLEKERFGMRGSTIRRLVLSYDEYTGVGEAIGLHRVSALLEKAGKNTVVKQSRTVSAEDLKNHDVILLGSAWVNEWSGKTPIVEDFLHGASATIVNQHPSAGEEKEYRARFEATNGKLIEDYALITVKPNISEGNIVMVLAGTHSEGTQAAAEYIASEDSLRYLNQRLRQTNGTLPKYYQVLLKVVVDNGIPTTISVVTIHELHSDKQ